MEYWVRPPLPFLLLLSLLFLLPYQKGEGVRKEERKRCFHQFEVEEITKKHFRLNSSIFYSKRVVMLTISLKNMIKRTLFEKKKLLKLSTRIPPPSKESASPYLTEEEDDLLRRSKERRRDSKPFSLFSSLLLRTCSVLRTPSLSRGGIGGGGTSKTTPFPLR